METIIRKSEKNGWKRSLRSCALLFSLTVVFTINDLGNPISANNSTAAAKDAKNKNTNNIRQTWNGTAWVAANQEDENAAALAKALKDADHDTMMNYLYMALGIGVIFALAWFTRTGKKKDGSHQATEGHHIIKHHHSSHDKRYGTNKSRA